MQTNLLASLLATEEGRAADQILRSCVHCGFCSATCPTYQVFGDELDSPRGRIYQIKRVLEGGKATAHTALHLDRCLSCFNCMTTCPSGVDYQHLLDYGRAQVAAQVKRPWMRRLLRWGVRKILPYPERIKPWLGVARIFKPILPQAYRNKIPPRQVVPVVQDTDLKRKMLVLEGCAQQLMTPRTNAIAHQMLATLGVELVSVASAGCCGAICHHSDAPEETKYFVRRNIDAWWPAVEQGAEAILATASGCGLMLKEYGQLLRHDTVYAAKAERISALVKDFCEVITPTDILKFPRLQAQAIAFHAPCTLQHGQKIQGRIEKLLEAAGYKLTPVPDAHMCCGSAGTYSILFAKTANDLLARKLKNLQTGLPEIIVTANIGCQLHLQSKANVPVKHWVELFAQE